MTKAELIAQVAAETGQTKAAAGSVVETLLTTVTKTLKKEGRFALSGLGVFEVVKRAKRQARNPHTNEPITVKAHKAVKFRAAKSLKDLVK
jgi:DNA-binding protein HU-beta